MVAIGYVLACVDCELVTKYWKLQAFGSKHVPERDKI